MADILTKIVDHRLKDIAEKGIDFGIELPAKRQRLVHSFLQSKGVILEVKRASPSKGDIAPDLDSYKTALSYASCGAGAISCLTESNYFKGSLKDLMNVCQAVDEYEKSVRKPGPAVLRKDFIVSEEEVDIAYRAGADAVLLISRILPEEKMIAMAKRAASYGMTSLIEIRLEEDVEKLRAVSKEVESNYLACGVNSRDLSDFTIDLLRPSALMNKIKDVLGKNARVIFESGIRSPQSAAFVSSMGFAGLLLGEAAAKNPSIRESLVTSFVHQKPDENAVFWTSYSQNTLLKNNKKSLVKICGLTNKEDAVFAADSGASFLGFIFYDKSSRKVDSACAEKILDQVAEKTDAIRAGVIVDPDDKEACVAIDLCRSGKLDVLQLHTKNCIEKFLSNPSLRTLPHYCAVNLSSSEDLSLLDELFDMGECRVLIDAFIPGSVGGTGKEIDASLVRAAAKKYPLWLAGGINPENVSRINTSYCPELIDLASGVEASSGIKDKEKIRQLFEELRTASL
ncbi:bifunctional indole-3-glycerol phosphate synthase/phosphoribosylanthranilate isomerase [Treponema sp.]|uniref:phosphoribosylanthranilate isomerase n=1 Tax=Treponema sp. TaxID=166 RepID=UPI0025D47DE6|nr:bifunctional indole-3-glycerol phosphate synthase/phosphoribosylanthranilate isomerase [Treponema sp.]MCR5218276.1 bifunctional indole-3-glycerol phosphate synthase/phosphoribosylanthranilate isomerase [Treponema sp.]